MPVPRSGGLGDEVVSKSYGFMEPRHAGEPPKTWSALSVLCAECQAGIGIYCSGPRFCATRMERALSLARSGQIAESTVSPVAVLPEPGKPQATVVHDLCEPTCKPHPHKGADRKLNDAKREEIVGKFKNGAKIAELARQYEVTDSSIRYTLGKAGVR